MIWKPMLWAAHHFFGLVSVAAIWVSFFGPENRKSARTSGDGRIEFAPSRIVLGAWIVLVTLLGYQAIEFFTHSHGKLLDLGTAAFAGLLALMFLAGFPGTVVVSSDRLQQVRWFWRDKRIRWKDIVEINTGKKSGTVTITGTDGTKIVHPRQFADRQRLLLELKQHCGENLSSDFPREPIVPLKADMHV